MGFFDALKGAVSSIAADAERALNRSFGKATFERVVQAGYLIAAADGNVDDSEKVTLGKVIQRKLPQFKPSDVAKAIEAAADECALSAVAGKMALKENISKAAGTDDAKTIMLCVLAVADADGEFADSEKKVAREICQSLGLRAADYGL